MPAVTRRRAPSGHTAPPKPGSPDELFEVLESAGVERCVAVSHREAGLRAFIVLDDTSLGPAAGGVRTMRYESTADALRDAVRLARAMTIKCALAGVAAGGGKAVVMDRPGLRRRDAFRVLGEHIDELGGLFRTAGDLGTTPRDLAAMAETTTYVHTNEADLAVAVARGVLRCIEACVAVHRRAGGFDGLRVAVQGCGSIGVALAKALCAVDADVIVADTDAERAHRVAEAVGARVCPPDRVLLAEVDVVAPCAVGDVITPEIAQQLRAWAVCGAANNALASTEVADVLLARAILHVPDPIASAGAVIDGIGATVMGLADRTPLIDALGDTALRVLEDSLRTGRAPAVLAEELAWRRIRAAAD